MKKPEKVATRRRQKYTTQYVLNTKYKKHKQRNKTWAIIQTTGKTNGTRIYQE